MCGIVGYIGQKKCAPILIDGLLKLEYRGYDSAGIAILSDDKIDVIKTKGRVLNLNNLCDINSLNGNIGIAHTRWATHGKPSNENSHPHIDNSGTFSVVHNGIIENYLELKDFLSNNGYIFYSQTDTEVIPNLIHYYFSQNDLDDSYKRFLKAVNLACMDLKGSFAIEVICKKYDDIMIVARKDSPLVIGSSEDGNYIASDIPAILSYTNKFYFLDDNEFALITKNDIYFYDKNLVSHSKNKKHIDLNPISSEKRGYEDYMLKEIYEQPEAIKNTIGSKIKIGEKCNFTELNFSKKYLKSINKIYIIACGTAMHAGLVRKSYNRKVM